MFDMVLNTSLIYQVFSNVLCGKQLTSRTDFKYPWVFAGKSLNLAKIYLSKVNNKRTKKRNCDFCLKYPLGISVAKQVQLYHK